MRIICTSIEIDISDCNANVRQIVDKMNEAKKMECDVLVFPELCITGYSCGDMFYHQDLIDLALKGILTIVRESTSNDIVTVVGLPYSVNDKLYDCAAVICNGSILGIIPKSNLANTNECYENRWFTSGMDNDVITVKIGKDSVPFGQPIIFEDTASGLRFGVEIGEDMWSSVSVSDVLSLLGANMIVNISAVHETVHKSDICRDMIRNLSRKQQTVYVYCAGGAFESTTDVVYSEYKGVFSVGTKIVDTSLSLEESYMISADVDISDLTAIRRKNCAFRKVYPCLYNKPYTVCFSLGSHNTEGLFINYRREPFLGELEASVVSERISVLQQRALLRKMRYTGRDKIVIGVSGGADSTVALLSCAALFRAMKWEMRNIIGVSMPGPGTTERTRLNAVRLMQLLDITVRDISIVNAVEMHIKNIQHQEGLYDITYEQTQSRERTKILMDIANKESAIVIGTGDMSEFALGWMSYSGDHISMYAVNSGIPKTVVKHMLSWYTDNAQGELKTVLTDIFNTPISPELLPLDSDGSQKQSTENLIGPYIIHDFFLYHFIVDEIRVSDLFQRACRTFPEYTRKDIKRWLSLFITRFFTRQFKRTCFSDGVQVFDAGLSPRGYWRMPSDVSPEMLLKLLEDCE
ncbi:NAD(+) synthase [uncultured Ruminococcus sp.]|uniref:NAD(+) synthase n=1 Tax=uncultured Ruminococcus sp. TaxID=165186 RepID=UPI0025FC66E3|nr:NAD(+) synthase [uncultured Ruminococcus sp.]